MEQLYNGFHLELPPGAFPLSTDSMVLAHFARLPKNARVLDLGLSLIHISEPTRQNSPSRMPSSA